MGEGWDPKIDPDASDRLTMGSIENARRTGNWRRFGLNEKFASSSVGESVMITSDDFDLQYSVLHPCENQPCTIRGGGQVPQENERTTGLESGGRPDAVRVWRNSGGKVFTSEASSLAPASWATVSALKNTCSLPNIKLRSLSFMLSTSFFRGARIIRSRKYSREIISCGSEMVSSSRHPHPFPTASNQEEDMWASGSFARRMFRVNLKISIPFHNSDWRSGAKMTSDLEP